MRALKSTWTRLGTGLNHSWALLRRCPLHFLAFPTHAGCRLTQRGPHPPERRPDFEEWIDPPRTLPFTPLSLRPARSPMTVMSPALAYPPHLVAAPTSRRSYQREPSPGDSRSPRRFSHSRGRPGVRSESLSRSDVGGSVSRDRSESDQGSRAPLWRRREGVRDPEAPSVKAPEAARRERLHPIIAHFLGFRSTPYVSFDIETW